MVDWTEKHRPRSLSAVIGNRKAVRKMQDWAGAWDRGSPAKKALILDGPPGVGKTSSAIALSRDMGWGLIELNASDQRNAEKVRQVATQGALSNTFSKSGEYLDTKEGHLKLILLDEADNLYEGRGQGDRGGKRAIIDTIRRTRQPVILIVNDKYQLTKGSGSPLKSLCTTIKFYPVDSGQVASAAVDIAKSEGHELSKEAAMKLADRSGGDIRSLVNDLQSICTGQGSGSVIDVDDLKVLGFRDEHEIIYDGIHEIFSTMSIRSSKDAFNAMDQDPEHILLWLEENVPYVYKDPASLEEGLLALSRADIYLTRSKYEQAFRLWAYAIDMMTGGLSLSKPMIYPVYGRMRFPNWLMVMSRSRSRRKIDKELLTKIGEYCHASTSEVRNRIYPDLQAVFENDKEFALNMIAAMNLDEKEVAELAGETDQKDIMELLEEAELVRKVRSDRYTEHRRTHSLFERFDQGPEDPDQHAEKVQEADDATTDEAASSVENIAEDGEKADVKEERPDEAAVIEESLFKDSGLSKDKEGDSKEEEGSPKGQLTLAEFEG